MGTWNDGLPLRYLPPGTVQGLFKDYTVDKSEQHASCLVLHARLWFAPLNINLKQAVCKYFSNERYVGPTQRNVQKQLFSKTLFN
jgi:hypothetical protein